MLVVCVAFIVGIRIRRTRLVAEVISEADRGMNGISAHMAASSGSPGRVESAPGCQPQQQLKHVGSAWNLIL